MIRAVQHITSAGSPPDLLGSVLKLQASKFVNPDLLSISLVFRQSTEMTTSTRSGNSSIYRYNAAVEEFRETEYPMIQGAYVYGLCYDV